MKREVEFRSATPGELIRADLYTPDTGKGPWPLLVMGGGWCYVKELIMPEYGAYFLREGVATLIFDYRHLGASDGEPRQHLDPWKQIADYRSVIDGVCYLDEYDGIVDRERLGVFGISYSGGHVLILGALEPRVRAIVSVVPVIDGYATSKLTHSTLSFRALKAAVEADRRQRYFSGKPGHIPHSGDATVEVVTWPHPETKDVFMKIKATTAPRHEHYSTIESVEHVWAYDVQPYLPRIVDTPTMMVVAEGDDLSQWDMEIDAFNRIRSNRKRLFVVPKSTHMSLYSNMSHLEIASTEAAAFLREWLVGPPPAGRRRPPPSRSGAQSQRALRKR
jgi:pimeloyl-ACP methyl ester carboxylesterase